MCCSEDSVPMHWGPNISQSQASVRHRELLQKRDPIIFQRLWELHRRAICCASHKSILEFASNIALPESTDAEAYDLLESHSAGEQFRGEPPLPPGFQCDQDEDVAEKGWEDDETYALSVSPLSNKETSPQSSNFEDEVDENPNDIEHSCFLVQPWECAFPEQMRRYLDLCDRVISGSYFAIGDNFSNSSSGGSISEDSSSFLSSSTDSDSNHAPSIPRYPISAEHLLALRSCIIKFRNLYRRGWETTESIKAKLYTHQTWFRVRNNGSNITLLMKSGGLASALRESISIEEEWPEQMEWGMPIPKTPREKLYEGELGKPQWPRRPLRF